MCVFHFCDSHNRSEVGMDIEISSTIVLFISQTGKD